MSPFLILLLFQSIHFLSPTENNFSSNKSDHLEYYSLSASTEGLEIIENRYPKNDLSITNDHPIEKNRILQSSTSRMLTGIIVLALLIVGLIYLFPGKKKP